MKSITNIITLFLLLGLFPQVITAQENEENSDEHAYMPTKHLEHGLNITQLAAQFIPFRQLEVEEAMIGYQLQRIKDRRLFRFGLGLNLVPENNGNSNNNDLHINIRLGFGKEHPLSKRVTFYKGMDFWLFAGVDNTPFSPENSNQNPFNRDEFVGIGLAPFLGIKFHISPVINLGTESHFFFGYNFAEDPALGFRIIPPLSLFLAVRLKR